MSVDKFRRHLYQEMQMEAKSGPKEVYLIKDMKELKQFYYILLSIRGSITNTKKGQQIRIQVEPKKLSFYEFPLKEGIIEDCKISTGLNLLINGKKEKNVIGKTLHRGDKISFGGKNIIQTDLHCDIMLKCAVEVVE